MQTDMAAKLLSPESSDFESVQNPDGSLPPPGVFLSLFLFGGAICWTIHLLFIAIVTEWGCVSGMGELRLLGITGIAWSVIVASLFALALTGWAMRLSLESCRQKCGTDIGSDGDESDGKRGSGCYLAQVAVWSNGLFLLVIVAQTIPILFYLTEC